MGLRISRRRFLTWAGGTAVAGGVYACGVEPLWIETHERTIHLARLPERFDGFTIVQLSDLHSGDGVPRWHLQRAVRIANSFAPDLIVITGDLVDAAEEKRAPEAAAEILSHARAREGVFAVAGNHDTGSYKEGNASDPAAVPYLSGALAEGGVTLLANETHMFERDGSKLRLVGLGDLWSGDFDPTSLRPRPTECTIALSHNPDTAPALARRGVDLVLSGHTHGGQIRFPLVGPPWIPLRHKQFLKGHFHLGHEGRTQLYVNRGLGWTHRIRFRARPEVAVLRLSAGRLAT